VHARAVFVGFVVAACAVAACTLLTPLDDLGGGDAAGDVIASDAPADAAVDGPVDAGPGADAPTSDGGPVVIAQTYTVANGSGLAQQTHVIWAAGAWWFFYIDSNDATLLKTRRSIDFVQWTDGPSITLPYAHSNDARAFSVGYANVAGADVVHITFGFERPGNTYVRMHARGVISGATFTTGSFATVDTVTSTSTQYLIPDGTVTAVGSDGYVTDTSGWQAAQDDAGTVGKPIAWRSTSADLGNTWSSGFGAPVDLAPTWGQPPPIVHAREIATLSGGDTIVAWQEGFVAFNVLFSEYSGGSWSPDSTVFGAYNDTFNPDDWSLFVRSPTDVHGVRRYNGAYEHVRFNGTAWNAGATIPNDPYAAGTGVFVGHTSTGVGAFAIADDGSSSVRATVWDGAAWSQWTTLVSTSATRTLLAGYSSQAEAKTALIWTEPNGAGYQVVGVVANL
jgi:hypothetical protein